MPDGPPRLRTLLLLLTLGKAAILIAILTAVWILPHRRIAGYPARLVSEANALFEAPRDRTVHREPITSGTFGERAAVHVPALAATARAAKDALPVAKAIARGERPASELPPELAPVLARAHAGLTELLAGTRAPLGELPIRWEAFLPGNELGATAAFPSALDLLAVEARQALASGRGREALAMCADGLALGRDLTLSGESQGLVWHMLGASIVARLAPVCAEAASADPAEAARMFRAIRDASAPFPETLRRELVCLELFLFSASLGDARAGLGPHGRACVAHGDVPSRWNVVQHWILADTWPDYRSLRDAVIAAAQLEGAAARRQASAQAYSEVTGRAGFFSSKLLAVSFPNFGKYGSVADDMRARLDALVALAVAADAQRRTGRWPSTLAELVSTGALTEQEARRLSPASLHARGDGLLLRVPLLTTGTAATPSVLELSAATVASEGVQPARAAPRRLP